MVTTFFDLWSDKSEADFSPSWTFDVSSPDLNYVIDKMLRNEKRYVIDKLLP